MNEQTQRVVGVGVVGLGFMGQVHLGAYRRADKAGHACRIAAVCDADKGRLSGGSRTQGNIDAGSSRSLFDPASTHTTTSATELFSNPGVELVSITTPTDSHVDLAIKALEAGKHVLVEKPVARTAAEVARVVDAARASDRICMPAFCIRFWPAWSWLKVQVDKQTFGAVRSATFDRLSSAPTWGTAFYRDESRSGAALIDLHIHDADFIRFLLGDPQSVVTTGTVDHLTTIYRYANGPNHVVAQGAWDFAPGFDFRMRYLVNFEKATVEYRSGRDPEIMVYRGGHGEPVSPEAGTGYDHEVRHILGCVRGEIKKCAVTIEDALGTAKLLDCERESLQSGEEVAL